VDAWDGLTHDRPYRKARSQEEALDYIRSGAGKEFDPNIVENFFEWYEIKSAAVTAKLLEGINDTGEGITVAYQHP
jgi:HD-GYP domain-containing protein (c-di-GMP phosphodiesterase class II)